MHAEIKIGNSAIMLADECNEMDAISPETFGGSPVIILLYFDDVDRVFDRAIQTGATVHREVRDPFYGDRSGTLTDPFGHIWTLATHKEDLTPDEIRQRYQRFLAAQGSQAGSG